MLSFNFFHLEGLKQLRKGGAPGLSALLHQRETKMLRPQSALQAALNTMKVFTAEHIWQIC